MKAIIDRFEDSFAVLELEDGSMVNIDKSKLPSNATVGDLLILSNESIMIDEEGTTARRKEIESLMNSIWED